MIARNLFWSAISSGYSNIKLAGFDVEKPDLVETKNFQGIIKNEINGQYPVVDILSCRYCGVCASYCQENAIQFNRYIPSVSVILSRCSACGRCILSCNHNALALKTKPAGAIWKGEIDGYSFIAGQLYETSDLILPLIQALHNQSNNSGIVICDFCPGARNSVSIGLHANDIAVVIVNPEPEWKKNLNSMQEMVKNRKARIAVIYNTSVDCNLDYENDVKEYCLSQSIFFLGIIPNLGIFNTTINDISSNKTNEVNGIFLKIWGKIVEFYPQAFA